MAETLNGMLFRLENVSYRTGGGEILKNLDLSLNSNQVIMITGPSGSGKSTLLRLMSMLISPTLGQILYQGKNLTVYDPGLYRARVLLVGQKTYLIDGTVRENLMLPFGLKNNKERAFPESNFPGLLSRVGLDAGFMDKQGKKISGGEAQRIALIRALALNPETLLLDEPTSALDMATEETVIALLKEEKSRRSIIVVAHTPAFLGLADRVVILKNGEIVNCRATLTPQEFRNCLEKDL